QKSITFIFMIKYAVFRDLRLPSLRAFSPSPPTFSRRGCDNWLQMGIVRLDKVALGLGIALLQTYPEYKESVNVILTVMTVAGFMIAVWDFFKKDT
ncbi:MAG TPA: hypothetical protein PK453_09015, partial [Leptospiraceae bacterium]|nr:hypothetical protein [Leptospiraceae bacterium]